MTRQHSDSKPGLIDSCEQLAAICRLISMPAIRQDPALLVCLHRLAEKLLVSLNVKLNLSAVDAVSIYLGNGPVVHGVEGL